MAIVLILAGTASAGCGDAYRANLERGDRAIADGRFREAVDAYLAAVQVRLDSGVALFNLGYAYYRLEQWESAADVFAKVSEMVGDEARGLAYYNLGTALAKQRRLPDALTAFRSSLLLRPEDEDARYNYVLVERWLEGQTGAQVKASVGVPPLSQAEAEELLEALAPGFEPRERATRPRRDW